jgi:NAD(P)-dependent dehydrogenase (short-subunit alcohol dehydrogenase family)
MEAEHLKPYERLAPHLSKDDIAGKTVLITGGGYGIGVAIAKAFAQASAKQIILVGRTKSRLDSTADSLSKDFPSTEFTTEAADVTSKPDVSALFSTLSSPPDILINNAGFMSNVSNFLEADLDDYWKSFTINVYGTALVTQSLLKHREANKPANASPAVVITLNTIAAVDVRIPLRSAYAASKTASMRWSELMQEDFPTSTARFISIHPGAVETDMAAKAELGGAFPFTDAQLAAEFIVWATTEKASFLAGRMAFVNWDKDKVLGKKDEIVKDDLLRSALKGSGM